MIERSVLYSIAGLCIGFIIGRWFRLELHGKVPSVLRRRKLNRREAAYDPHALIPNVIPNVTFDASGEPLIAREEVHRPSPIPRTLTIIIIVFAALSLVYIAVSKSNEAHDAKVAQDKIATQVANNKALVLQLQHQQGLIDANEKRLEDLVLAISTAKTPGEVTAAIQRFLKSSAQAQSDEEKYQQKHGGTGSPHTQPSGHTRGSPSPRSSPTARPSNGPQPSGSPTPSYSPSQTPQPSPSPSSPPVQICVVTPLGKVCEPAAARILMAFLF